MADSEQVSPTNLLDQLADLDPQERQEVATIVRGLSETLAEVPLAAPLISPTADTGALFTGVVARRQTVKIIETPTDVQRSFPGCSGTPGDRLIAGDSAG
jgi:hypothetical protein